MSELLSLMGVLGLGSVLTLIVQALISREQSKSDRAFSEKKEAYIGLLEAYHRVAVEGTNEAAKNFAYWRIRCELVGPKSVRYAIRRMIETNDDPDNRALAHEELTKSMRLDLKIVH